MSSDGKHPKLLQVYNISTAANNDVIRQLFQYFGRIEEFQVYPVLVTANTKQKVAYIRYDREKSVLVAQHLTNTVFFDRALVCVPATSNTIPDEDTALQNSAALGKRALPANVVNKIEGNEEGQKMLYTIDPTLTNLGLPLYPPLGADLDPEKIEETRRTIYVGGLKKDVDPNDVIKFFNTIGEVMYLRMANITEHHDCAYCYIEFTNQTSVPQALQNDGVEFQGQPIRIQHSRVAIVKPQQKTNDQAMEEIEEAMRRRDKGERSPVRKRSRSPGNNSRRRSRSPRRTREREREVSKSRRDKERDERDSKKDKDRDLKKDKERDRDRKQEREKDRGKDSERRNRSRDREDRSRDKERKEKSRDEKRDKDKKSEKDRDSKRDDRDKEKRKDKDKKGKDSDRRRSRSPKDSKKERRSRSRSPDRKKKREDEDNKKSRDRDNSSSSKSKKESNASERVADESLSSSLNRGGSLDAVETSLRERLLAKQLEKKRRGSDEMDISD